MNYKEIFLTEIEINENPFNLLQQLISSDWISGTFHWCYKKYRRRPSHENNKLVSLIALNRLNILKYYWRGNRNEATVKVKQIAAGWWPIMDRPKLLKLKFLQIMQPPMVDDSFKWHLNLRQLTNRNMLVSQYIGTQLKPTKYIKGSICTT